MTWRADGSVNDTAAGCRPARTSSGRQRSRRPRSSCWRSPRPGSQGRSWISANTASIFGLLVLDRRALGHGDHRDVGLVARVVAVLLENLQRGLVSRLPGQREVDGEPLGGLASAKRPRTKMRNQATITQRRWWSTNSASRFTAPLPSSRGG